MPESSTFTKRVNIRFPRNGAIKIDGVDQNVRSVLAKKLGITEQMLSTLITKEVIPLFARLVDMELVDREEKKQIDAVLDSLTTEDWLKRIARVKKKK